MMTTRPLFLLGSLFLFYFLMQCRVPASCQLAPLLPGKAAALTELPVGPWGPYAQKHLGPCYVISRKEGYLLSFPLIVGQQRTEVLPAGSLNAAGQKRMRPEKVTLLRRGAGLSSVQAVKDARGPLPMAKLLQADAEGLFWKTSTQFEPAEVVQEVFAPTDAQGFPLPVLAWGKGVADVSYFPTFAGDEVEGLLISLEITNTSAHEESYFVDCLAGVETQTLVAGDKTGAKAGFSPGELVFTSQMAGNGLLIQTPQNQPVFCVRALSDGITVHSQKADSQFFHEGPALRSSDEDKVKQSGNEFRWGLLSLNAISVEPGHSRTVVLCVGMGKDADSAGSAADTLLSAAETHRGKNNEEIAGLISLAARTGQKAAFHADASLQRLMAQSLGNTPLHDFRRVGVPSRQKGGSYVPGESGWMGLGWGYYRPDWAAAQCNAWLLSGANLSIEKKNPMPVLPTDLFALWELSQITHDSALLERLYPNAVRRYREFIEAGRVNENEWVFAWSDSATEAGSELLRPKSDKPRYAPEYSAYVIRSARMLRAIARVLDHSQVELDGYSNDIANATQALNLQLWDANKRQFVPRPAGSNPVLVKSKDTGAELNQNDPAEGSLKCLLPLIAGMESLSAEQETPLWNRLFNRADFWGNAGIRSFDAAAPGYHAEGIDTGGVRFGDQWLFWKAMLDRGMSEKAAELSTQVLKSYSAAVQSSNACPEWLQGDTGVARGVSDYAGDSCALFALYAAYHQAGRVTSGWETWILENRYHAEKDSLHLIFRALDSQPRGVLICVMGKPGTNYQLSGSVTGVLRSDANGVITLTKPAALTVQQVDIAPAGSPR